MILLFLIVLFISAILVDLTITLEVRLEITPENIILWYKDSQGNKTFKILYNRSK